MRPPFITDYVRILGNPVGVFRTLGEPEVSRDVYGELELRSGNSAAVFTYMSGGEMHFLKCYVRQNPRLRQIYDYIEDKRPALLSPTRLLRDELYVHSLSGEEGWMDVVEGEWVEGETLDSAICRAAKGGHSLRLHTLADNFDSLCRELLAHEWAHGDLTPENIIVRADGSLALIDCDALWIPAFAGQKAVELGTPGYRHPKRGASHFDKRIDDYSMMLISVSLHALALSPELYSRYNTADNIILSPIEIVEGRSAAYDEITELFAKTGRARELRITQALASVFPEVENVEIFFTGSPTGKVGGLVAVVDNGKWGFADEPGNYVIDPFWDEVLDFRDNRAAVRLGRWWHFIAPTGKILESGLDHDQMKKYRQL